MRRCAYNPNSWTWGAEIELGDVQRAIVIPKSLGSWEYAETDIVNQREPYRFIAADPLGLSPPVGGEVNMFPANTVDEQLDKINNLIDFFISSGCQPTVSRAIMELHIHVHIPNLVDDINALKNLTRYVSQNQHDVVRSCVQYKEHPLMRKTKTARTYLKWDMGRTMPDWMANNIIRLAGDFDSFIVLQQCGKDGVSKGRPFRYCVNTYCLKHTETIEFRCFRATLDIGLMANCFNFVKAFMEAAFSNGLTVQQIISSNKYVFPPFEYNHEEYLGWESTKWEKSRGKKIRTYIPI